MTEKIYSKETFVMANRPFVLNHSCIAIEYAVRREKLNVLLGRQALMPIVKGKKSTKMFSRQFPHFEKIMSVLFQNQWLFIIMKKYPK